jgi:hypothetical protein
VFNDLKRSLESDGPISSLWATRVEAEHRSVARSIFEGVPGEESYALITSCSDVVDFLKPSKFDPAIGLIFNSYQSRVKVYICS